MNTYSSRKVMIIISVITVILLVFMLVSVTGCGRRIARAKAIAKILSEESDDIEDADDTEDIESADESDENSSDGSSQQQENDEDDTTIDTSSEESTIESDEDEQDDTSSQEDNVEESIESEESSDDEEDEDENEEIEQHTADMPSVEAESGNIWEDEAFNDSMLVIGDTGDDIQSRAYVSFDITELTGATITDVLLHGEAFEKKGKPFATYGPMIVKAVYWGPNPINASMFNMDGVEIKSLEAQNFGIGNNNLKNDLQNVANSGGNRYQVMLYFEMDGADGDGEADYIMYDIGAAQITLNVTYTK